jgi:hypothetical protein
LSVALPALDSLLHPAERAVFVPLRRIVGTRRLSFPT